MSYKLFTNGALHDMQANELFKTEQFGGAQLRYEEAAGIFRYCESSDPDWRTNGIKDDTMRYVNFKGDSDEERLAISKLLCSIYTNISILQFRNRDFSLSIKAADYALEVIDASTSCTCY